MIFDVSKKNLIYVNSVYHDNKTNMPSLIGVVQALHIAYQVPAMPVFLTSRDNRAVQTAVLIAYALGIKYPQQNIYKNPNFEIYWKDSLHNMIYDNKLSDRCLAIAVSTRPVINEVAMGVGNRNGDITAFQSSTWDEILEKDYSIQTSQQADYQYMQKNFASKYMRGLRDELEKALYQKTMYKFVSYLKTKENIMAHQIYSNLYNNSF